MAHNTISANAIEIDNSQSRLSRGQRDAIVGLGVFFALVFALVSIDFFDQLFAFTRAHESWELDEWLAAAPALAAVSVWFAFRRWRDADTLNRRLIETNRELEVAHQRTRAAEFHGLEAQRLEALGRLAGGFSHELNNMFQPAITLTQLVLEKEPLGSDSKESLAAVLEACRCGQDIVKKTMMLARAERPPQENLLLTEALQQAVDLSRSLLPDDVAVETDIDNVSKLAFINKTELIQVITNLMTNGAKAMPTGGVLSVRLSLETVGPHGTDANTLQSGEYFQITVADNGVGMSKDVQRRIFDPFFTTAAPSDMSQRNSHVNIGLGLSIVYGIIRSWNGLITVDSSLNEGSRFRILLPAYDI